ncbi:hypothetical protein PR202_gb18321 [Eleusine coracana subsp. coracana]|uniref:THO complex subunit 1 n=1 Tax=Eleusine coracana subsp. coracana TaxID=191504 RepID=A0AAV5F4L2_ELECO|nr:hypothetical protein PR202_gb18321 [Eleusine coracana subsp. coracana]
MDNLHFVLRNQSLVLLDIVLYLCERGHVEGGMVFQLLEDLTEMSTIKDCKDIFGYIESKQDVLGKQELFGRGKLVICLGLATNFFEDYQRLGRSSVYLCELFKVKEMSCFQHSLVAGSWSATKFVTLLNHGTFNFFFSFCNNIDILHSEIFQANDVVFCGRIIMFLAHFFPLSERSALNIKGVFNTSNATKYEKDATDGISVDFNFYKTLWSLQEHFSNPSLTAANLAKWQNLNFLLVLIYPVPSYQVVLSTFEAQPLSDDDGKLNNFNEEEDAAFNIKYLTSSKLMGLELKDPSFRRHILVQCLIFFDYLKAPGKNDKEGPTGSMKEEIKSCEEHVKKLLEIIPPKGKEFLKSIEHILEREKNWVWWKRDGCPAYEKHPYENKSGQAGVRKRYTTCFVKTQDTEVALNALTNSESVRMPSITEYWKPLAEDMDPSAGIEEEYHHKSNRVYCWKGLRFSARQDLELFSRFSDYGIEGVVPSELLPPEVNAKFSSKPAEKAKRPKRDDSKGASSQAKEQQVAATPETDGGGSGADPEEGALPMDSDTAAVEDGQKRSPEEVSGPETGQIEAETEADAEDNMKTATSKDSRGAEKEKQ